MTELVEMWKERIGGSAPSLEPLAAEVARLNRPDALVSSLERLLESLASHQADPGLLADPLTQRALARIAYAAPFLIRLITGRPALLTGGALANLDGPEGLPTFASHLSGAPIAGLEPEGLQRELRRWKYSCLLRLTARDLMGLADTPATCAALSSLADEMIRVAYDYTFTRLVTEHGLPLTDDGGIAGGAVIGMGKLGGSELNYSSDVDLIFIHDGEEAPCRILPGPPPIPVDPARPPAEYWGQWAALAQEAAGAAPGSITTGEFHNRLVQRFRHLVSAQTAEGFGFRVDLDLRPMGKSGLDCPSLAFVLQYYDIHGREWERVALLKARQVAGSPQVYGEFRDYLRPFVYRRYLDYGAIEGITIVKRDIDRHNRAALAQDIKLGRGGIRENEFFVQAMQLLYGGKDTRLQVTSHAKAVARLVECGLITQELGKSHLADYWLLRRIENRIQMVGDSQTQQIPADGEERQRVFFDFAPDFHLRMAGAEAELDAARGRIAERFSGLLNEGEARAGEEDDWRGLLEREISPEIKADAMARVAALLDRLMTTRTGESCVIKVERLLANPALYARGTEAAFPRWLELLERIGNRNPIYALLAAHPDIVGRVSRIFSEGGRLAFLLIRHPEFLESLATLPVDELGMAAVGQMAGSEEEFILDLQSAKSRAQIRILAAYLESAIGDEAHRALLTLLADETVAACLDRAWRRTVERFGLPAGTGNSPHESGFAVLAMGKLGSREMRFGSDLDLVYCYREDGVTAKGASHFEFYTKLGQTLNSLLTVPTQFGLLYQLDHRLRPFGGKGALVPSLEAYRQFLTHAEVWNFQALSRVRPLAGDEAVAGELGRAVAAAWRETAPAPGKAAEEIHTMLHRLVGEHGIPAGKTGPAGPLSLKYAVGGLIGFEFLQQFFFLDEQRGGGPWQASEDNATLAALRPAYRDIGLLDERLSLYSERYRHEPGPSDFELEAIAARWQYEDARAKLAAQEEAVEAAFRDAMSTA